MSVPAPGPIAPSWRALPAWARPALAATTVLVVGLASIWISAGASTAIWWPAIAVLVAAVLRSPRPELPAMVAALAIAVAAANLIGGRGVATSLGYAVANIGAALGFAWLYAATGARCAQLRGLDDVIRVLLVSAATACLGGALVATATGLADGADVAAVLASATMSQLTALLVVLPLALVPYRGGSAGGTEAALQMVALVAALALALVAVPSLPLAFVLLPVLAWGAVRLGPHQAVLELVLVAAVATGLTAAGVGPFTPAHTDVSLASSVILLQAFLASTALTVMPLTVLTAERTALTEGAHRGEALYRRGFEESLVGMAIVELAGSRLRIVQVNEVAARIYQRPVESLIGESWCETIAGSAALEVRQAAQGMFVGEVESWTGEVLCAGSGCQRTVEVAMSSLGRLRDDDERDLFSLQLVDVTERRHTEARLADITWHDDLTGLANRPLLHERLRDALQAARDGDQVLAVLLVDIDDFKRVNDSGGHELGDRVLREVGHRLLELVRPEDTVARVGSDEFVVLCPDLPHSDSAVAVADRLADALGDPVDVEVATFNLGASIGVAVAKPDSTVDTLLSDADAAMHAAKKEGKSRARLFTEEHRADAVRAMRLEGELTQAVDRDELRLAVQPIVDLRTGAVVAAETLVRWQHPDRGLLLPGDWLDIAERTSLIHPVGTWVLRESCRLAAQWRDTLGPAAPPVHVNVSPRQLDRGDLVAVVRECLDESGLEPTRLSIELTETDLTHVAPAVRSQIDQLRALGVHLAADDFGTGYSTLTHVTELTIDILKVDRSFVAQMGDDERSHAVVQAVVGIGQAIGASVVAEGVETVDQVNELLRLGCPQGQGYLFSPPQPPTAFLAYLRRSLPQAGAAVAS